MENSFRIDEEGEKKYISILLHVNDSDGIGKNQQPLHIQKRNLISVKVSEYQSSLSIG